MSKYLLKPLISKITYVFNEITESWDSSIILFKINRTLKTIIWNLFKSICNVKCENIVLYNNSQFYENFRNKRWLYLI